MFALVVTELWLGITPTFLSQRVAELFAKAREVQGVTPPHSSKHKYYIETGKIEDDDRLLAHMGEVTALCTVPMAWTTWLVRPVIICP